MQPIDANDSNSAWPATTLQSEGSMSTDPSSVWQANTIQSSGLNASNPIPPGSDSPSEWQDTTARSEALSGATTVHPPVTLDNVWADNTGDSHSSDEEQEFNEVLMELQEEPSDGTSRRRKYEDSITTDSPTIKRVAISGPNQDTLDSLREREEISRQRAIQKSVTIRQQAAELQKMDTELGLVSRKCDEYARQREEYAKKLADMEDTETQMAEQIIQSEKRISELIVMNTSYSKQITEAKTHLERQQRELQAGKVQMELQQKEMEAYKQQMEQQSRRIEEMMNTMANLRSENEREKATVQTTNADQIMALREQLRVMSNTQQAPPAPGTSLPTPTTSPRARNRNRFLRGNPATVGVVPLRPVPAPANAPGRGSEEGEGSVNPIDYSNPNALQAIVKETLRQMNIAEVHVSKPGPKKTTSARMRNREVLVAQKRMISKADDLAWKEIVRMAWKTHFKVNSVADFAQYHPAPGDAVESFETGPNGPDQSNTLDFTKGFEKSRWNKVIIRRLYNQLLVDREADGTWNVPDVSEAYLIALFYGQLKRSREAWSLVQQRPDFAKGQMETQDDVSHRVSEYMEERNAAVASRSRREQKYMRRIKTVENVIVLKTESGAPDLETWIYFRELLTRLSTNGMSSEEEGVSKVGDITVPVFRVKLCVWRNTSITDYFKYVDKESQSQAVRGKQGARMLPRIYSDEPGTTDAPRGLPAAVYDSDWLSHQEESRGLEWIEQELKVSQEVFEMLEFTATL